MQKIIPKKELDKFVKGLLKNNNVIAPVQKKITQFDKISSPSEIHMRGITLMPLKDYFIPEGEVLFEFENNIILPTKKKKDKPTVVFGMRKCDLNALLVMDKVMFDPGYIEKRKNTTLIGMFCDEPDEYCFCNSMELVDYYDLFFYPDGNNYHISIGSPKGAKLVAHLKDAKKEVVKDPVNFKKLENKDIAAEYMNKRWNSDVDKCISCAACTVYCPTCNCFDIKDVENLDSRENSGQRVRTQTSCQLPSFTEVGGGKSFRATRAARFKHFVFHKIVYYKHKFNKFMCVGCGRCLRACPPKIDWVDTINKIKAAPSTK